MNFVRTTLFWNNFPSLYWDFKFLNNVIINRTKGVLSQAWVT